MHKPYLYCLRELVSDTLFPLHLFPIAYVIYMSLNLVLLSISGNKYAHYGMIIVPALAYPVALLCGGKLIAVKERSFSFVLYLVVAFTVPKWIGSINNAFQLRADYVEKGLAFSRFEENTAQAVLDNTSESDRIIVCGNWNIIYLMTNRMAASKYSYQNAPCSIDEEKRYEFMDDINKNMPKCVVVLDNAYMKDWMMEYVSSNEYMLVHEEEGNNTRVHVYCRNE